MRMTGSAMIAAAYTLDSLAGDPEGYPHPVRLMGGLIGLLERRLNPVGAESRRQVRAGYVLAAVVIGAAWAGASLASMLPGGTAMEILMIYTALARKDLEKSALGIAGALETGDAAGAKRLLPALVGRDPESLDEQGMCRAAVESVAENYTDGVLAPLLWTAAGGARAAMAFKAVSTLDSMLGHRDERHMNLGQCSARLDDIAVFPAARISIPLVAAAARIKSHDAGSAWRVGWRDRGKHASPNSACAEAAFAGALGLRLGGEDVYAGDRRELPEIGEGARRVRPAHIREAVELLNVASLLGLALSLLLAWGSRR